jgi:hypothetical protein
MQKEAINDDVLKYRECLARIQWHLRFVEKVNCRQPLAFHDPATELIFLHFRKALEELVFSSLCANVDKYSSVHEKFNKHGQLKNILIEIAKLNPHFFPMPIPQHTYSPHSAEPPHDPVTGDGGCLSRTDIEFQYALSSKALHTRNPYRRNDSEVHLKYSISEWIERFRKLLRVHLIRFVDSEEVWTAVMPDEGSPGIGVARLVPIPNPLPRADSQKPE